MLTVNLESSLDHLETGSQAFITRMMTVVDVTELLPRDKVLFPDQHNNFKDIIRNSTVLADSTKAPKVLEGRASVIDCLVRAIGQRAARCY